MPDRPRSPDELFSEAVDAHQAGRLDEAESLYRHLLGLAPGHPEILNLLGVIQAQKGRAEDAVRLISQAVAAAPDHDEARYNLGTALLDAGRPAEAAEALRTVIDRVPGHTRAAFNLGMALKAVGRNDEAAQAFRRVVDAEPDDAGALAECAACLAKTGHTADALGLLERAVDAAPENPEMWFDLGSVRLREHAWDDAVAAFNRALDLNPWHVRSIAFKGTALHEAGHDDLAAGLIDLDRLITVQPLSPDGADVLPDRSLVDALASHPSLMWERPDTTTMGGAQTANLADDSNPSIAAFVAGLTARVEAYVASVGVDPSHPFTRRVPSRWRYSIWATVLHRDGHQAPHLHPGGWLSGVYYAEVPDDVLDDGNAGHAGWIEFGAPGYGVEAVRPPRLRYVRPERGTLVLFPSCLFHRTVPLDSPGRRISVAFDLIPTEWRAV